MEGFVDIEQCRQFPGDYSIEGLLRVRLAHHQQ
jgi:hypothetical protein